MGRRKRRGRNVFLDLLVLTWRLGIACGVHWLYALLGFTVDTCTCLGPGGFLGRFPHFLREGGPWLLRSILAVTCLHGFFSGPRCPASWSVWTRRTFMPRLHGRARRRLRHSHVRSLCPCCATAVLWSDSAEFRASFRRGRSSWS